ncbi:MAG: hypothetical protein GY723_08455 [bacterium]|nr:hypothetical protein [bacterium]
MSLRRMLAAAVLASPLAFRYGQELGGAPYAGALVGAAALGIGLAWLRTPSALRRLDRRLLVAERRLTARRLVGTPAVVSAALLLSALAWGWGAPELSLHPHHVLAGERVYGLLNYGFTHVNPSHLLVNIGGLQTS